MYGKIKISADITILTGMHIGGSNVYSAIGAVDSPVIRDAYTKNPIIPGSSLKGKLRTLLARSIEGKVYLGEPNEDKDVIRDLFGSSAAKDKNDHIRKSRLQFSDSFLINKDDFLVRNIDVTEVKFENTINRCTSVANPRQIERVVRGAKFGFNVVYDIDENADVLEDIKYFSQALKLLQMDYLGGHGTRGYGKVKFSNFRVEAIEDSIDEAMKNKIMDLLKDVEKYELLPL